MTSPFTPPFGYDRLKLVNSFQALVTTPFARGVNALCWPRTLPGNFCEIAERLGAGDGIITLDDDALNRLPVSTAGRVAVTTMQEDLRLLQEHGLAPALNGVHNYPRDQHPGSLATDVFSFHADSAPVETDTWLCTYHGPPSEGLRNDEAQCGVDIPEIRAELLRLFGGKDDDSFRDYLKKNYYNLHYLATPSAQPFSFGMGCLWRIAVDWPGSSVPPCIHRAPAAVPGQSPRLLLIS